MQTVDERPETIHLYVVREEKPRPSFTPIVLSALTLLILVVVGMVFPYRQPEQRAVIRVPAVFLPLKVFTTSVQIIPTGIKTYPATNARGILTIYNGSIFSQGIPQGMILTSKSGVQIVTDTSVFVPAGNPPNFGSATVSAHTIMTGDQGNIQTYDINVIYGSALYIRNLSSFHGGKHRSDIPVITAQDRQTALDSARASLTTQKATIHDFLAFPCNETATQNNNVLTLSWTCQFVTYSVPPTMRVLHVRLIGTTLLIDVAFVARPKAIWFK